MWWKIFLVTANALICSRCGDRVPIEDGVIDFVRGSARTLLDDIDYDDFYRVTKQTSFAQISSLIDWEVEQHVMQSRSIRRSGQPISAIASLNARF